MNTNISLKVNEQENIIWLIYLFIIGANFISNYFVEKYLYSMDNKYKKIFRNINILVLSIALLIYIYYVYLSYKTLKKDLNSLSSKLIFIASILILIGGIIYLGIEIYKNENPEIDII